MKLNSKHTKILLHLLFWFVMLLFTFTGESWQYGGIISWGMLIEFSFVFMVLAAVVYFNNLILIPRLFRRKKYLLYFAALICTLCLGSLVALAMQKISICMGLEIPPHWEFSADESFHYFRHILWAELLMVLIATFFYVLEEFIQLQKVTIKLKDVEKEKIQAQLQELKAQINPHFLFNTLNNIYSHSLSQSPQTPKMILMLSDLMSYILYDCNEDRVAVENELEFVRNYVELEKLRYEESVSIKLSIVEEIKGKRIAPLIFIPLIENAFKHCGSAGSGLRFIDIDIHVQSQDFLLRVANSIDEKGDSKPAVREGGIGIENVKRRLNLLYDGLYTLTFNKQDDVFVAELRISDNGV